MVPGTYVSANCCPGVRVCFPHTRCATDSHRSHRSNAATHTPCVCDTSFSAVLLLWLDVFVGSCRSYFIICCLTGHHNFFHTFLTYKKPRQAYLYQNLSPCCFFCVLLCVIQQCHRSSCARHSAPTAEAGSIPCACGRCALPFQGYTAVKFVDVIGIGLCTYLLLCATGPFFPCRSSLNRVHSSSPVQPIGRTSIVYSSIRT